MWEVPHLRLPSKRLPGRLQLLRRHHRTLHAARGPQRGPLRCVAGGTARHGRGTCWGAPEGQGMPLKPAKMRRWLRFRKGT